eukprot:CAMPEP_0196601368 /NCGR_PEP_ID=MMETSP1081-20130531/95871_1 /TAXON_ID=36882 /ORGANISM="Pyramimonas amylifera, Strain CCMP720" /LENGTH=137 /DNA_ID=CAMNT_0041927243 /DNA_START=19 /DNA_END=432 /DNA_ORIENTATION=+
MNRYSSCSSGMYTPAKFAASRADSTFDHVQAFASTANNQAHSLPAEEEYRDTAHKSSTGTYSSRSSALPVIARSRIIVSKSIKVAKLNKKLGKSSDSNIGCASVTASDLQVLEPKSGRDKLSNISSTDSRDLTFSSP